MSVLIFQTFQTGAETLSESSILEAEAISEGRYLRYADALARYGQPGLYDKAEADGWIACVSHDGFWRLP